MESSIMSQKVQRPNGLNKSKNKDIVYKHERTVRVISYFKNKGKTVGTGFLMKDGQNILTCWHVICGIDLKDMLKSQLFLISKKSKESEKVDDYYRNIAQKIKVELPDGRKIAVKLDSYDYFYDIAVLKVPKKYSPLPSFEFEPKDNLDYNDEILYPGYPTCLGYNSSTSPFAINSGNVSSFPNIEIAGGKYEMIQLSSICIGGNSGAPIFKEGSNKPIAILNGYEWRECNKIRIPINISYATGFNILSKRSRIFQSLIKKSHRT